MRKSKGESERKNKIVRNKTVDRAENSAHTHARLSQETNRTPYTFKCQYCGCEFTTHFHTQKYCSTQCYADAVRHKPKTCQYCREEFQPAHRHQKYCSAECYHLASRTRR